MSASKTHTIRSSQLLTRNILAGCILLASMLLPQITQADSLNDFQPNVYLDLNGGMSLLGTTKANAAQNQVDDLFRSGYNLGAAVGYEFNPHFRSDISTQYINYRHREHLSQSLGTEHQFQLYQVQVMVNGYLQLPFSAGTKSLTPFIGAGVGYNWLSWVTHTDFLTSSKSAKLATTDAFSAQASAGINYALFDNTDLGAVYRFSITDSKKLKNLFPAPQQIDMLYNQSIILQLTLHSSDNPS